MIFSENTFKVIICKTLLIIIIATFFKELLIYTLSTNFLPFFPSLSILANSHSIFSFSKNKVCVGYANSMPRSANFSKMLRLIDC